MSMGISNKLTHGFFSNNNKNSSSNFDDLNKKATLNSYLRNDSMI